MQHIVDVRNLRKSYNGMEVVKGIDLQVQRGELFALLGPNGAGKTTTIHMLSTLLKPDEGKVFISGFDAVKESSAVRKRISLTGQFAALDEELTGFQNIMLVARLHGHSKKQANHIAKELINSFKLNDAKDRMIANYSGGMRRRLDIAASIVTKPDLIFLDEPTTGLDPQSRIQVWDMIRTLLHHGTTVLLTTQYLEEADQLADRVAVIDEGQIIAEGTPSQLKASIGEKTLTIRLTQSYDIQKINHLLTEVHGLRIYQDNNPLVYKIPVKDSGLANRTIHTLLDNDISIDNFALEQPSLDAVFLTLTDKKNKEAIQ